MKLLVLARDHPGDELSIHTIGLATKTHRLGIVACIPRIEDEDEEAELVGKLGQQLVIAAG